MSIFKQSKYGTWFIQYRWGCGNVSWVLNHIPPNPHRKQLDSTGVEVAETWVDYFRPPPLRSGLVRFEEKDRTQPWKLTGGPDCLDHYLVGPDRQNIFRKKSIFSSYLCTSHFRHVEILKKCMIDRDQCCFGVLARCYRFSHYSVHFLNWITKTG